MAMMMDVIAVREQSFLETAVVDADPQKTNYGVFRSP
jgi:hypothetical protein